MKKPWEHIVVGRRKGPNAYYIGRPSPLGNPFAMRDQSQAERDRVCEEFEKDFEKKLDEGDPAIEAALADIMEQTRRAAARGEYVTLACFCAPKRCHGDTIRREVIRRLEKEKRIEDTGFGWVSPSGKTRGCECLSHFAVLQGWDALKGFPQDFLDCLKEVDEEERGCKDLEARGEHGEWHTLEMATDRVEDQVKTELYRRGFVRVGSFPLSGQRRLVEFEGTPAALLSLGNRADRLTKEIAESRNVVGEKKLSPIKDILENPDKPKSPASKNKKQEDDEMEMA
jgi:hypothetical protein